MGAYRYANARPMMRVGCIPFGSPKVGFSNFKHAVNTLPNLKVMRIELGQDSKCQGPTVGGWHVGHTLVLSTSTTHNNTTTNNNNTNNGSSTPTSTAATTTVTDHLKKKHASTASSSVSSSSQSTTTGGVQQRVVAYQFETPKYKKFFKTTHPDLKKYISTLEEMSTVNSPWVTDFVNKSGEGVVINNESRQVV